MSLGVMYDPDMLLTDIYYSCTLCRRQFYDGGAAAHHTHCPDYRAGQRTGGLAHTIRIFGPDDLRVRDGAEGVWARAMARPNEIVHK